MQIMNSVPPQERGQASGIRAATTNTGQVLSIGLFFSLMLAGLAATLPQSMEAGLLAEHVPRTMPGSTGLCQLRRPRAGGSRRRTPNGRR
jgi:hypothetical protein